MGLIDAGARPLQISFADIDQPACYEEGDDREQQQPGYFTVYDNHYQGNRDLEVMNAKPVDLLYSKAERALLLFAVI